MLFAPLYAGGAGIASDQPVELQKLEVTGSRIKRADIEGIAPVVVLNREYIDRTGAETVSELFRDVIFNNSGLIDETFTQGFAPASAGIDLRGLGVNRTLVLIDGRRVPLFPFGQDAHSSFVDVNLISLGAIERIEILKDGASAIYGSDAIAGVVNIITRKDAEGADLSVRYGGTSENDGQEGSFNISGGLNGEGSNLTVGFDYLKRKEVKSKDRDISASANGPIDDRSIAGKPGTTIRAAGFPEPDPRCPPGSQDGSPFCVYDFAPWTTLIPEVERIGVNASGYYDLSDDLRFFASALYTNSDSSRDLAASSGFFGVSGDNPNTIYPGEDVGIIYRVQELGSRTDNFHTDFGNGVVGLSGVYRDWDWESSLSGGKVKTKVRGVSGYATGSAVQEAIDDGTLNVYGDSPNFDSDSVSYKTKRDGESKLYSADFRATGDLYEMEHGALALAVGAEYHHEDYSDKWDPVTASGEVLSIGGTSGDGDRDSSGAYLELSVPVLSELELQLAGRYDHYSDFGGTFNPKAGLRWQPKRNLLLRASAGTGFKAPSLQELYSGEIESFEGVFDPETGEVVEVVSMSGGNRDLDAEKSDNYSLGAVWDITNSWNLAVDYWRIKTDDAVTSSPQYYVDNEDLYPDNVVRDDDGNLIAVFSPYENVSAQKAWGIDANTGSSWNTDRAGVFGLNIGAAYLGSFKQEPVPGAGYTDLAGKNGRPEWRGQGVLTWSRQAYAASLIVNYVGSYDRVLEGTDNVKVDSWTTVDAQFNWSPTAFQGGKITVGATNLFDEEPPEDPYLEGWPFFNRALHSARGRFLYAQYGHEF